MRKIGNPPREVADWLNIFARDNEAAAKHTINPIERARLNGRASAFRTALEWIQTASQEPGPVSIQFPEPPKQRNDLLDSLIGRFWKF